MKGRAMDDALAVVVEMSESMWTQLRNALQDMTDDEIHWRPLSQANSINVIVRHLRIEAEWHLNSLQRGEPMPTIAAPVDQTAIDAVTFDFHDNLRVLEELYMRFVDVLKQISIGTLRERSASAYGRSIDDTRSSMLAYHQATHLAVHTGQIRATRNLYRKTRGEPARFFPQNPTFPAESG